MIDMVLDNEWMDGMFVSKKIMLTFRIELHPDVRHGQRISIQI